MAQPVYRMQVLQEKPGEAIANSKTLPMAAQFFPYLNLTFMIFGGPAKGTFAGPCVHYSHYQQKLMDLYGVQSTVITGYGHSALQFEEGGRTYVTDNGSWYQKIVETRGGNWAPEGSEKLYEIVGSPNPLSPYLFPGVMFCLLILSYFLEGTLGEGNRMRIPFRSQGKIKTLPAQKEFSYRKTKGKIVIDWEAENLVLEPGEFEVLEEAPDIFFHKSIGNFKLMQ